MRTHSLTRPLSALFSGTKSSYRSPQKGHSVNSWHIMCVDRDQSYKLISLMSFVVSLQFLIVVPLSSFLAEQQNLIQSCTPVPAPISASLFAGEPQDSFLCTPDLNQNQLLQFLISTAVTSSSFFPFVSLLL